MDIIDQYFPYKSYRPGQREAIEFILNTYKEGKKYVILECPTGSGKSAIAYTVAMAMGQSFYLTATKILQSQLIRDFGSLKNMAALKGRSTYMCNKWKRPIEESGGKGLNLSEALISTLSHPNFNFNCNVGFCKLVKNQSACEDKDRCEYWQAVYRALGSKMCVMNFDSFLYQTSFNSEFINQHRRFMCLDEAHNTESKLLDFVTLSISDRDLRIRLEEQDTPEDYRDYFADINLGHEIREELLSAKADGDIKKTDRLINLLYRIRLFNQEINRNKWICHFKNAKSYRIIEIKPLFVNKFAGDLIFDRADNILLMSATILSPDVVAKSLGIDEDDMVFYTMPSNFPKKNRPIYLDPCGSLSYKNKYDTFPKLVKKVDAICDKYKNQKGIIHTHNFEIANLLIDKCKNASRFLFQKDFKSKQKMLAQHDKSKNSVIVAPAMHEGLDLSGDTSRFQIISKIPYVSQQNNPQLKERTKISWRYYVWLTALKLIQSYGRSVRHDKDWAHTYIIDSDFEKFLGWVIDMNLAPSWFLEAIEL